MRVVRSQIFIEFSSLAEVLENVEVATALRSLDQHDENVFLWWLIPVIYSQYCQFCMFSPNGRSHSIASGTAEIWFLALR